MNVVITFQNVCDSKDLADRLNRTVETLHVKRNELSPNVLPILTAGQQQIGSMRFGVQ